MEWDSVQEIMIMTVQGVAVPSIGMVPGGLISASIHISMACIIIIQSLVYVMVLFGQLGKVSNIPSDSR